jgi:hypothetical protein
MLMSAPIESTLAALLVLFGMIYTVTTLLNGLIDRSRIRKAALETAIADDSLLEA